MFYTKPQHYHDYTVYFSYITTHFRYTAVFCLDYGCGIVLTELTQQYIYYKFRVLLISLQILVSMMEESFLKSSSAHRKDSQLFLGLDPVLACTVDTISALHHLPLFLP